MGIGGKFFHSEVLILKLEDSNEASDDTIAKLQNNVIHRSKILGITATWKFVGGSVIDINAGYYKDHPSVFRGTPTQIIPYFLVIWDECVKMNCTPSYFNFTYTFGEYSGSVVFNGYTIKIYLIGVDKLRVTQWTRKHLNSNISEWYNFRRPKNLIVEKTHDAPSSKLQK